MCLNMDGNFEIIAPGDTSEDEENHEDIMNRNKMLLNEMDQDVDLLNNCSISSDDELDYTNSEVKKIYYKQLSCDEIVDSDLNNHDVELEANDIIPNLKFDNTASTEVIQALSKNLQEVKEKVSFIENTKQAEVAELKSHIKYFEEQLLSKENQIETFEKDKVKLEEKFKEALKQKDEMIKRLSANLDGADNEVKNIVNAKEEEIKDLKTQMENLKSSMNKEIQLLNVEKTRAQEKLHEELNFRELTIRKQSLELRKMKDEVNSMKNVRENEAHYLRNQNRNNEETLKKEVQLLQKEKIKLQRKYLDELSSKDKEIRNLSVNFHQAEKDIKNIEKIKDDEINCLKIKLTEMEKSVDILLEKEKSKLDDKYLTQLREKDKIISDLSADVQHFQEQLGDQKINDKEVVQLKLQVEDLKNILDSDMKGIVKESVKTYVRKLDAKDNKISHLESELCEAEERIQAILNDREANFNDLLIQLEDLKKDRNIEAQAFIQEKVNIENKYKMESDTKDKTIGELLQKVYIMGKETESVKTAKNSEIDELRVMIKDLENQQSCWDDELKTFVRGEVSKYIGHLNEKNALINDMKMQLSQAENRMREIIMEKESEVQSRIKELEAKQSTELQTLKVQLEEMHIIRLNSKDKIIGDLLSNLSKTKEDAQSINDSKENEISNLKVQNKDLIKRMKDIKVKLKVKESELESLNKLLTNRLKEIESLHTSKEELQRKIIVMQDDLEIMKTRLETKDVPSTKKEEVVKMEAQHPSNITDTNWNVTDKCLSAVKEAACKDIQKRIDNMCQDLTELVLHKFHVPTPDLIMEAKKNPKQRQREKQKRPVRSCADVCDIDSTAKTKPEPLKKVDECCPSDKALLNHDRPVLLKKGNNAFLMENLDMSYLPLPDMSHYPLPDMKSSKQVLEENLWYLKDCT